MAQPGDAPEAPGPDHQNEPHHPLPEALFSRFPLLPAEIQIQIWEEAASPRRVVFMALETAGIRNEQLARGQPTPNAVQAGRVPALLHATHQSRQACLPIYKHRFQIRGPLNNLWETYILADHDTMALSVHGLLELVSKCGRRDEEPYGRHGLPEQDGDAWRQLLEATASFRTGIPLELFRDLLTPRIIELLETGLQRPDISGFRGDLGSIKRLMLYHTPADERWPGLYRDPAVLANLDRGYPLVADRAQHFETLQDTLPLAEGGVTDLPERYRCRPLGCPSHPEMCDRQQPAIAITRTTFDMGQWLAQLAAMCQQPGTAEPLMLSSALAQNWARDGHDVVMWCFSEPRYGAARVPPDADELTRAAEAYAGYVQAHIWGLAWRSATVYDWHGAPFQPCPRVEGRVCKAGGGPLPSQRVVTPGCWRCENPPPPHPNGFASLEALVDHASGSSGGG